MYRDAKPTGGIFNLIAYGGKWDDCGESKYPELPARLQNELYVNDNKYAIELNCENGQIKSSSQLIKIFNCHLKHVEIKNYKLKSVFGLEKLIRVLELKLDNNLFTSMETFDYFSKLNSICCRY
jgi:hypothetical protein